MRTEIKLKNILMAMLIMVMGVAMAACSSKDDDEPKNEGEKPSTEEVEVTDQGNGVLAANGLTFSITSFSDNTVEVTGTTSEVNKETFTGGFVIPAYIKYQGKRYSVTSIGEEAFEYFEKMTSIKLPATLVTIGESAFFRCYSLTSIVIPEKVTTIGRYAFDDCKNLVSIEIPNSVTTIEKYAFYECNSLKNVTIPSNVVFIGDSAFDRCPLTTITVKPSDPPQLGRNTFDSYGYDDATLVVPKSSLQKYKDAEGWSEFKNIITD